jgi:hypothetical protein
VILNKPGAVSRLLFAQGFWRFRIKKFILELAKIKN